MNDAKQLEHILVLLKESYTCTNSSKLQEVGNILNSLSQDVNIYLDVLFHGLSLDSFNKEQIPFELHQSLAVNLKNIIENKKSELNDEQISYLIKRIFELYFPHIKNKNLIKDSLLDILQHILKSLLSLLNNQDCDNLFLVLLNAIKMEYQNKEEFAINAKIVIKFFEGVFQSSIVNKDNFIKIINEYYIAMIDTVFKNVPQFIDPEKNMFSVDYFEILNILMQDLFKNLNNISTIEAIDNVKYCEIISSIAKKYGKLILELIKIQIPLGQKSKNIFINQNPIISFTLLEDEKLHSSINTMKSNCFQFLSFTIGKLSIKSKKGKFTSFTLKDQYLIELLAELTKLVISSLQDILSNKEKFLTIKRSKEGIFSSDNNHNNLLYHIFLYLSRCLTRNPIIKEFSSHMKYFMLNILFPLATLEETEKQFMEEEPDTYITYLEDILYNFKFRNFRTSLCFLFKKICEYYDDSDIILNYIIEMVTYTFDINNKNNNNICEMNYNIYLNEENKSLLNNFNDEIKIDFCFFIILLLKSKITKQYHLLNKFMIFFISNQEKIHQINSELIIIKVCEIYKEYIPSFFNNDKVLSNQEEQIRLRINTNFIESMINFLFNIILNSTPKKNGTSEIYKKALVTKASDAILSLLSFTKENHDESIIANQDDVKINRLHIIFPEKIRKTFKLLIGMINTFRDNTSFVTVLSNIINDIKINERQDLYNCLKLFTNIFVEATNVISDPLMPKSNALFINQYFILIKYFLTGENKLNNNEINLFNEIISPVFACVKENDYLFYEDIIQIGEYYMKSINGINELSLKILENMYPLIKKEKALSGFYYSFISTFLSFINNYNINTYSNSINIIMKIIKCSFSFLNRDFYNIDNMVNTLLLSMQILSFENAGLNNDDINFLISANIKYCFEYFDVMNNTDKEEKNEESFSDIFSIEKIKQILLSNFSIFSLYYSDMLFKILSSDITLNEIINGKTGIKNVCDFIIKLFGEILYLTGEYFPILGKCDILCLCSLFSNKKILNNILNDNAKKKNMFILLVKLVSYHNGERKKINMKLTDNDVHCDFIDCEEFEENSENKDDDKNNNFMKDIKMAIKNYENIIKCDEFKIFSDTFVKIKNEDENLMNEIMNEFNKDETAFLYKLLHVRNIKVEFNGVQIEIPRRTLKIKRNIN